MHILHCFEFMPSELAEQNSKSCKICISQHDALECNAFSCQADTSSVPLLRFIWAMRANEKDPQFVLSLIVHPHHILNTMLLSRVSNKPAHTQDRPALSFLGPSGPCPGAPCVYRVSPDLPLPPKRWCPASGSPGRDPVLDTLLLSITFSGNHAYKITDIRHLSNFLQSVGASSPVESYTKK
jgi:hypothetical protein